MRAFGEAVDDQIHRRNTQKGKRHHEESGNRAAAKATFIASARLLRAPAAVRIFELDRDVHADESGDAGKGRTEEEGQRCDERPRRLLVVLEEIDQNAQHDRRRRWPGWQWFGTGA